MKTRDELGHDIVDMAIDFAVEDMGHDTEAEKSALIAHLKGSYDTSEEWNPPLEEMSIGSLLDEMQLSAATFMDGWVAALKASK
ncbi:hypothetical protein LCGC14_0481070 [marine sediment metagenome]|uniref:Uncharacterized protein n=1 Tax=marine sediment metagenome TaxID=412755 RepID=A0A0F9VI44_9ZZZZ